MLFRAEQQKRNMNIEQVREYTLSLLGVTEDQPFGDDIITRGNNATR